MLGRQAVPSGRARVIASDPEAVAVGITQEETGLGIALLGQRAPGGQRPGAITPAPALDGLIQWLGQRSGRHPERPSQDPTPPVLHTPPRAPIRAIGQRR